MSYEKIKNVINSREIVNYLKQKDYNERERILFHNPNLRQYCELNYYTESSLDWNLQGEVSSKTSYINYPLHLCDTLDYTLYIHPKGKLLENDCKIFK